jgi:hypothetical protein
VFHCIYALDRWTSVSDEIDRRDLELPLEALRDINQGSIGQEERQRTEGIGPGLSFVSLVQWENTSLPLMRAAFDSDDAQKIGTQDSGRGWYKLIYSETRLRALSH